VREALVVFVKTLTLVVQLPAPDVLPSIVIQEESVVAVHGQPSPVTMATPEEEALAPNEREVGFN
jgi:hypothetical protein